MRSLRARLILGVSIVALVPLALSISLLSRRVEGTVREQAAQRLDAALARLEAQLALDGEGVAKRLERLAGDPGLKRLYLVRPDTRDLAEHLEQSRSLLGLDFLQLADTSGAVVADADAATALGRAERAAIDLRALPFQGRHRPRVETLPGSGALVLAASEPIRYEGRSVGLLRGGLALDPHALMRLRAVSGVDLALIAADGHPVASTLESRSENDGASAHPAGGIESAPGTRRVTLAGRSYWSRSIPLTQVAQDPEAGRPGPRIAGLVPTAAADRAIADLQHTALLLGLVGLLVAIALGVLWSSQVSRPVEQLAALAQRIARGEWDEPVRVKSVRELQTLVQAFERMRSDLAAYRERLVTSERQAAWGQMARMVAHEIKNPLTPIAISVADLKRSYERDRADFPRVLEQAATTIAAEVDALKRILQEFSDFARLPAPRFAACRLSELLADLETFYGREASAGRLAFPRTDRELYLTADQGLLRQALFNLIQNGLDAIEPTGLVTVSTRVDGPTLEIAVVDDGEGLSAERRAALFVPGLTTKPHGSGLGLTIVQRIVNDHGGSIAVESQPGNGSAFRMRIPLDPAAALQPAPPGAWK